MPIDSRVEMMLSLGKRWCEMLVRIQQQNSSRAQLVESFRSLRNLFSDVFDCYLLDMSTEDSKRQEVDRRCHFKLCADCLDKFTCLTDDVVAVLRCRRCGVKWFHTSGAPNANGDSFPRQKPTMGSNQMCPIVVCGETCPICDYVDEPSVNKLPEWLEKGLHTSKESVRNFEFDDLKIINESQTRLMENPNKPYPYNALKRDRYEHQGCIPSLSTKERTFFLEEYEVHIRTYVDLLIKSKLPLVMSLSEFIYLLDPVPDSLRGFDHEILNKYDSKNFTFGIDFGIDVASEEKDKTLMMIQSLANRWNTPPLSVLDAL